jgi:hypothetical protein
MHNFLSLSHLPLLHLAMCRALYATHSLRAGGCSLIQHSAIQNPHSAFTIPPHPISPSPVLPPSFIPHSAIHNPQSKAPALLFLTFSPSHLLNFCFSTFRLPHPPSLLFPHLLTFFLSRLPNSLISPSPSLVFPYLLTFPSSQLLFFHLPHSQFPLPGLPSFKPNMV